ncbi:MAG TPA: hypothetical protein VF789_27280 [Thermoanaerobaculia bacterium]
MRIALCVLLVFGLLAAAPLQAKPSRVAANGTPVVSFEVFLSGLWQRAARLLGVPVEKEGTSIDPDGATNPTPTPNPVPEGTSIDPNGRS